jgi:hypothetical protein
VEGHGTWRLMFPVLRNAKRVLGCKTTLPGYYYDLATESQIHMQAIHSELGCCGCVGLRNKGELCTFCSNWLRLHL